MRISHLYIWAVLWLYLFGFHHTVSLAQDRLGKIALVIGNTEYTDLPRLRNASSDAKAMARSLSDKGFTVFLAQDLNARDFQDTLTFVSKQAANADQIVVYYAGHNEIRNGTTQMLPINSKGEPDDIAFSIPELLAYFDVPFAQKAFILDACLQDPPSTGSFNAQTLLLPSTLGLETLVVFATSYGQAAYDGRGRHSVFTGALLDDMTREQVNLERTMQRVRKDVIQSSRAHQTPLSVSTLTDRFILGPETLLSSGYRPKNNLIQSYSSTGFAEKPLLDIISSGISPGG